MGRIPSFFEVPIWNDQGPFVVEDNRRFWFPVYWWFLRIWFHVGSTRHLEHRSQLGVD